MSDKACLLQQVLSCIILYIENHKYFIIFKILYLQHYKAVKFYVFENNRTIWPELPKRKIMISSVDRRRAKDKITLKPLRLREGYMVKAPLFYCRFNHAVTCILSCTFDLWLFFQYIAYDYKVLLLKNGFIPLENRTAIQDGSTINQVMLNFEIILKLIQ